MSSFRATVRVSFGAPLMKRSLFLILGLFAVLTSPALHAVTYPRTLAQQSARTYPYNLAGQLFFSSGNRDYIGSAVVIRPSSILTAGHNLYDPDTGWSTDLLFRRGTYGNSVLSEQYGSRVYLLSGYRQSATSYGTESLRAFAADTGGIRFSKQLAAGAYAAWSTNTALLTSTTTYKIAVGFGAEGSHDGDYPLYVSPTARFRQTYGGFYENTSIYFEGGMSGGPVFCRDAAGKVYVTGVVVSGSAPPYASGGMRILNSTVASLIRTYLP